MFFTCKCSESGNGFRSHRHFLVCDLCGDTVFAHIISWLRGRRD